MHQMPAHSLPTRAGLHPILILASIAVIIFCGTALAAIMGWLPTSSGKTAPYADVIAVADTADKPANSSSTPVAVAALTSAPPSAAPVQAAAPPCLHCGRIESIRTVTHRAQGTGVGAAGGAVLGGLLGHQLGGGRGRDLATVAGAVGGAVAGNQIEGNMNATSSVEIRVRLDDGKSTTVRQASQGNWHDGDRVRVKDGKLIALH